MRDLYGRNGAETISGLCGTRVVLAAPDRDTAQWSADSLGRSEVEEVAEGYSYGANTIRDGVSLTPRRELRSLALPSEIMRLPNLEGYLKFPGPFPVASIRLKYVARAAAAERFVPREEGVAAATGHSDTVSDGALPEVPDLDEAAEEAGPRPDMPSWQGELDLIPPDPGQLSVDSGAGSGGERVTSARGKPVPDRTGRPWRLAPMRSTGTGWRTLASAGSEAGRTTEMAIPGLKTEAGTGPGRSRRVPPPPAR